MEPAPKLVIARPRRGRGNLAVPCRITGKLRRNRNCLPEIAPQGHFLALRAQGATSACGLLAMTNRKPSPLYHTRHESGTCHGASRTPPPTTHDRRLPVILPARFCGKAPPQSSSGSLLCFCCLIQISITSLCGSSFTSRTCQRTGRPWMETSFFVRYRSCRAVFITSFASYSRL